jgi:hypothetical protein
MKSQVAPQAEHLAEHLAGQLLAEGQKKGKDW